MDEIHTILWLVVAIITLIPTYVFWAAYWKMRSKDLLINSLAFSLFFIKALILAMKLFIGSFDDEIWWSVAAILDIFIVGLITFSFFQKLELEKTFKIGKESEQE
jgi:hypothetical protein